MCTNRCVRPGDVGLAPAAVDTLASLLAHPVVRLLAATFRRADGQLFVVGGPVRDALRGSADFADLDFTTDLRPDRVRSVLAPLGTLWTSGERFGTIGVSVTVAGIRQKVEVTTFRTETYAADSRKPQVGFGDSILQDLRRRDLTVNAVALNVLDGCLVDPFDGVGALAAGILDTPDDPVVTLSEDPLRILRALRFAGRLGAELSPRLREAVRSTRDRLRIVAADRRLGELDKLAAVGSTALAQGLAAAQGLGVLDAWVPGAADPAQLPGLASVADLEEALAALLHHDADVRSTLRAMRLPNERLQRVARIQDAATGVAGSDGSPADSRRLLRRFDDRTLAAAARISAALAGAAHPRYKQLVELAAAEPDVRVALPVNGTDLLGLGLKGRQVGAALAALEDQTCLRGHLDRDEALAFAANLVPAS